MTPCASKYGWKRLAKIWEDPVHHIRFNMNIKHNDTWFLHKTVPLKGLILYLFLYD